MRKIMQVLIGLAGLLFFSCSNAGNQSAGALSPADSIVDEEYSNLKVSTRVFADYTPDSIIIIDDRTRIVYLGTDTFIGYEKQRKLVRCKPVIVSGSDTIEIPSLADQCGFQVCLPDHISPNKQFIDLYQLEYGWVVGDTLFWHESAFNSVIDLKTGDCLNSNYTQSGGAWTSDNKYMLGNKVIFDGGKSR